MSETCKHSKEQGDYGLCWGCRARRRAEYELTGTHDPKEQKKHWDEVWAVVKKLQKEKFLRNLRNGTNY